MQAEPPKDDPPKRKRRWFQFSLCSLMMILLADNGIEWLAQGGDEF
jgi:hypothetical protein